MPELTNKRSYPRFQVPGATLSYKKEICQVVNLGKGGLSFSTNNQLKPAQKLSILLTFSAKDDPIQLQGQVVYCMPNPTMSQRYNIGIRFAPFSTSRGHNSPKSHKVLEQLENTYLAQTSHRRRNPQCN